MKAHWKDYFSLTRKEKSGIIFLICLIVIAILIPHLFFSGAAPLQEDTALNWQVTRLLAVNEEKGAAPAANEEMAGAVAGAEQQDSLIIKPFKFDPNTLDEAGWQRMGVPQKNIRTILNYRNKGGRFYKPEDIRKIYGLKAEIAAALQSYIQIAPAVSAVEEKPAIYAKQHVPLKKIIVHINSAGEEEWKALPGIGEVLSKRIVKFRTKLGGFTSVDDVAKTYGLSASVFQQIRPMLSLE